MSQKKTDEQFSPEETKQRFEAALRGARVAGSKPMAGPERKPAKRSALARKKRSKPTK